MKVTLFYAMLAGGLAWGQKSIFSPNPLFAVDTKEVRSVIMDVVDMLKCL
jgi:hypothetical protein